MPDPVAPKSGIFVEFKKIRPYLKNYRYAHAAGIFALLATDIGNLLIPFFMGLGIDAIDAKSADAKFLLTCGGMIAAVALVRGLTRFGWRYYLISTSHGIERDMRLHFFGHIIRLPMPYFARNRIGDLLAYSSNDIVAVKRATGEGFMLFADFFFSFIGVLFFMLSISPELTLYALIPTPLVTALFIYLGPILYNRFKNVQDSFGALTTDTEETIAGLRVVRSYNQESGEYARFLKANQDYLDKNVKMIRIDAIFHSLMFIIPSMIFPIILVVGGMRLMQGALTIGSFVAFWTYIGQLVWPMMAIGWTFNIFQRAAASNMRVRSVFAESLESSPDDLPAPICAPKTIEVRNLTFTYPGSTYPALKNVTLRFPAGETIAMMGRTGSGKSTLLTLLMRLYDPPRGTIFYDGTDVLDIPITTLRSYFATVPQEPFLFTDTLRDNITFGKETSPTQEHDSVNDPYFVEITTGASLHQEVAQFPDGYETIVGERGTTLSGGQRQRTAIARAFHTHRNILILDDPLSAVDAVTEARILKFIRNAQASRSLLMVTNRVNAAQMAAEIIIFEHGEIVARGTHAELMKKSPFYAEIYSAQTTETAEASNVR